jgi:hypothetical protein
METIRRTKEKMIKDETNWLNKLISVCRTNGTVRFNEMKKYYHTETGTKDSIHLRVQAAVDLGFLKRVSHGQYMTKYIKFNPIHARMLMDEYKIRRRSKKNKAKSTKSKIKPKYKDQIYQKPIEVSYKLDAKPVKKEITKAKKQVENSMNRKRREFSFLWGLLKFNY